MMTGTGYRHKIVCYGKAFSGQLAALEAHLGDGFVFERASSKMDPAEMQERFGGALAVIAVDISAGLPLPNGLRLLQVPAPGWDGVLPKHVPLMTSICNVGGHEIAVAEYCVAQMLAWRHRLREAEQDFRAGSWACSGRYGAPPHAELNGVTVGIVGYGGIGKTLARLLHAFGVTVLVANRSKIATGGWVASFFDLDAIPQMLERCDFGVICLALTPETSGLVDSKALLALGQSGVILNVGRASVINESALYAALAGGKLGGAIIDVWYRYPDPASYMNAPPANFDFASLPNVIMTPQVSGWADGTARRRVATIATNIRRAAEGEALLNVVAVGAR